MLFKITFVCYQEKLSHKHTRAHTDELGLAGLKATTTVDRAATRRLRAHRKASPRTGDTPFGPQTPASTMRLSASHLTPPSHLHHPTTVRRNVILQQLHTAEDDSMKISLLSNTLKI